MSKCEDEIKINYFSLQILARVKACLKFQTRAISNCVVDLFIYYGKGLCYVSNYDERHSISKFDKLEFQICDEHKNKYYFIF